LKCDLSLKVASFPGPLKNSFLKCKKWIRVPTFHRPEKRNADTIQKKVKVIHIWQICKEKKNTRMMQEKCKSPIQETANVCRLLHFLYIKKWKKILACFLHLLRIFPAFPRSGNSSIDHDIK
jgi:hypothetical protein